MRAGRQRRESNGNRAIECVVGANAAARRSTDVDGICRGRVRQRGGDACRTSSAMEQNALCRRAVHRSGNQRTRGNLSNKQVCSIGKKEIAQSIKREAKSIRAAERRTRRRQLADEAGINVVEENERVVAEVNIPQRVRS